MPNKKRHHSRKGNRRRQYEKKSSKISNKKKKKHYKDNNNDDDISNSNSSSDSDSSLSSSSSSSSVSSDSSDNDNNNRSMPKSPHTNLQHELEDQEIVNYELKGAATSFRLAQMLTSSLAVFAMSFPSLRYTNDSNIIIFDFRYYDFPSLQYFVVIGFLCFFHSLIAWNDFLLCLFYSCAPKNDNVEETKLEGERIDKLLQHGRVLFDCIFIVLGSAAVIAASIRCSIEILNHALCEDVATPRAAIVFMFLTVLLLITSCIIEYSRWKEWLIVEKTRLKLKAIPQSPSINNNNNNHKNKKKDKPIRTGTLQEKELAQPTQGHFQTTTKVYKILTLLCRIIHILSGIIILYYGTTSITFNNVKYKFDRIPGNTQELAVLIGWISCSTIYSILMIVLTIYNRLYPPKDKTKVQTLESFTRPFRFSFDIIFAIGIMISASMVCNLCYRNRKRFLSTENVIYLNNNNSKFCTNHNEYLIAGWIGIANSISYLISAIITWTKFLKVRARRKFHQMGRLASFKSKLSMLDMTSSSVEILNEQEKIAGLDDSHIKSGVGIHTLQNRTSIVLLLLSLIILISLSTVNVNNITILDLIELQFSLAISCVVFICVIIEKLVYLIVKIHSNAPPTLEQQSFLVPFEILIYISFTICSLAAFGTLIRLCNNIDNICNFNDGGGGIYIAQYTFLLLFLASISGVLVSYRKFQHLQLLEEADILKSAAISYISRQQSIPTSLGMMPPVIEEDEEVVVDEKKTHEIQKVKKRNNNNQIGDEHIIIDVPLTE